MSFTEDFVGTQKQISQHLIGTIRCASRLSSEELDFHRSLDPTTGQRLADQNSRLISIAQRLIRHCASNTINEAKDIRDAESIDLKWRSIVDVADSLLERADMCIDEYSGVVRQASPGKRSRSPGPPLRSKKAHAARRSFPKPQLEFEIKANNNPSSRFQPLLNSKPHAITPLSESLGEIPDANGVGHYQHPYALEIESYHYPPYLYQKSDPVPYEPFNGTTAIFVEDMEGVNVMLSELKKSSIIALDLEHHDAHSYAGIVSLMQISTRTQDWIIDTLKPWRRKLEVLNTVLADPTILKVLHGAQMDILWLQRDLGLYVVGLFDTHHAARVLGYTSGSLAFLLKKFINFDAQKQYQTADWRERPLPQAMFEYARSDTHFLLYIFDHLRNELVEASDFSEAEQDKVATVLGRSKDTALQRYEHPFYDETNGLGRGGWFPLLQRTPALLTKEQFAVFRKVHHWRDKVARQEDESPIQIMPNYVLFNIARARPSDTATLLSNCHPISQFVRSRMGELLRAIQEAKDFDIDGQEVADILAHIALKLGDRHSYRTDSSNKQPITMSDNPKARPGINAAATHHQMQRSQFWGRTLDETSFLKSAQPSAPDAYSMAPQISDVVALSSSLAGENPVDDNTSTMSRSQSDGSQTRPEKLDPNELQHTKTEVQYSEVEGILSGHLAPPRTSNTERTESERGLVLPGKTKHKVLDEDRISAAHGGATDAFDYTTMPSILHASQSRKVASSRDAVLDPYAMALEAPSGARRAPHRKGGKSHTYRS